MCNSRIQIGTLHTLTHTLPHSDWLHCHSAVGYMPAGYTLAAQQIPVVTVTEHRTAQPNWLLCTSWHHRTISPELHEIKILDIFFSNSLIEWSCIRLGGKQNSCALPSFMWMHQSDSHFKCLVGFLLLVGFVVGLLLLFFWGVTLYSTVALRVRQLEKKESSPCRVPLGREYSVDTVTLAVRKPSKSVLGIAALAYFVQLTVHQTSDPSHITWSFSQSFKADRD